MKQFKCRASAIGKIMAKPSPYYGVRLAPEYEKEIELALSKASRSEQQQDAIKYFSKLDHLNFVDQSDICDELKISSSVISALQKKRIFERIDKSEGRLSAGGQSYIQDWLREQPELYGRRKEFTNKYTYKGNEMEDASIEFIEAMLGYDFLFKNEESFQNDWIVGTPDVIQSDHVIDVKNSFDQTTFPLFKSEVPSKDYWWQGQGYMWLTGRNQYKLIYTLMNSPEELIYSAARSYCYANYLDLDLYLDEVYEKHREMMTYDDVDPSLRIKVFEFDRDDEAIELIKDRVESARRYIDELLKTLNV